MSKCSRCKFCMKYNEDYTICKALTEPEIIEHCVAEDDNLGCDLYVENA